jgi:hypothetical protein
MAREYDYSIWGTQGGGIVRYVDGKYVFIKKPDDCMGFDVGDTMPEEWGIVPANSKAEEEMGY